MLLGTAMRAVEAPSGLSLQFADDFGGTNGTVPSGWTVSVSGSGASANQNGGVWQIISNDGTKPSRSVTGYRTAPSSDTEIVFTHGSTYGAGTRVSYTGVRATNLSSSKWSDGYFIKLDSTTTTGSLVKRVGNVETSLGTFTCPTNPWTMMASNPCRFRLSAIGSDIKVRVWQQDNAEPAAWDLSVTDSDVTAIGNLATFATSPNYVSQNYHLDDFECWA